MASAVICLSTERIYCLPNEEIFTELARMGYEKPSTKLTFYKAFFSAQWKFLIHTILQCMSAKRTTWNKFSSSMASAVICLSTGRKFKFSKAQVGDLSSHSIKYLSLDLTQKAADDTANIAADDVDDVVIEDVAEPTPPSPIPTTNSMDLLHTLLETCTALTRRVENLEQEKIAQALEITRKVGTTQKIESSTYTVMDDQDDASKQGRIIADLDADKDVTLEEVEVEKNADVQGRLEESQAKVYHIDLEYADKVLITAATTTITATIPIIAAKIPAAPSAIEQDEAYARELEAKLNKNINWDDVIELVKEKGKQDNDVLRYQALKRKPHTEAQARKNMMVYLKNMAGFKMDCFSKEELEEEESRALKRKTESFEEKAAKKQKLDKEVEELKKHLQIVPNDDDDVYTEATPLSLKVPVVDYEIHTDNNKPYYKIIRADGSHQLFLSFLSLLRNFDREDLEMLWQIVQERFASSKPKNFSDDFLLTTLKEMFEKPDVEA
nr:synaptobrevin, longin-like domain protein [Tanacetum cinerariifolium]